METGRFTFVPPRDPRFSLTRSTGSRVGERKDSRDSSESSRSRLLGSTLHENEIRGYLNSQSSMTESASTGQQGGDIRTSGRPQESWSKSRFLERIKNQDQKSWRSGRSS